MMASYKAENAKLIDGGFRQGTRDAEKVQCEKCTRGVSGTRSWWRYNSDGECEAYCRLCALFIAHVTGGK